MPNKDGTGPQGKGPGTGRRQGNCKCEEETREPCCGRRPRRNQCQNARNK